jgi:16S rRNA (cytidine1402-2'-O)-methyltransferase
MKKTGKLFLIPTTISNRNLKEILPQYTLDVIKDLNIFICENAKTARNHVKDVVDIPVQKVTFVEIEKHCKNKIREAEKLAVPLLKGQNVGFISEAGCPGIADPGSELILFCHRNNVEVVPLIGPSSIFLALMGSGLNGQSFKFVGYLSKDKGRRVEEIKRLDRESSRDNTTILLMETPYRVEYVWKDLIATCNSETYITVAMDITSEFEYIKTAKCAQWKEMKWPKFNKNQVIFLIQA